MSDTGRGHPIRPVGPVACTVDAVTPDFEGTRTKLVRTTMLLGLVAAVVVGVLVGVLLSWLIGAVVLLVVGGAWVGFVSLRVKASLDRVLHVTGARRVDAGSEPRWENTVDGLSMSNGIVDAELWIIESTGPTLFAAASADRTAFVTTTGLLGALGVVELEAVTANLVGRVKDGSARYGTVAVGVYGAMLGGGRAAQKLAASLGDQRAIATDLAAVDLTRYPPGLAAAFTRDRVGRVRGVRGGPRDRPPLARTGRRRRWRGGAAAGRHGDAAARAPHRRPRRAVDRPERASGVASTRR